MKISRRDPPFLGIFIEMTEEEGLTLKGIIGSSGFTLDRQQMYRELAKFFVLSTKG